MGTEGIDIWGLDNLNQISGFVFATTLPTKVKDFRTKWKYKLSEYSSNTNFNIYIHYTDIVQKHGYNEIFVFNVNVKITPNVSYFTKFATKIGLDVCLLAREVGRHLNFHTFFDVIFNDVTYS